MKQTLRTSLFLLLALVLVSSSMAFASGKEVNAPLLGENTPNAIPGRYIVVFNDRTPASEIQAAIAKNVKGMGGQLHYTYTAALKGFAASLPTKAVDALRKSPNVAYIELDHIVTMAGSQSGATWGLDRIDQRALPLNSTYNYDNTGTNVRAYIIDTGIRITHNEFDGERTNRAISGYDAVGDGNGTNDCNGHGTHVAGTVGGTTYGVAKGVTLYAVRVLDCNGSGTTSGVVAGIDWVTNNHVHPAVANMSLGGGADTALDTAVNNSINHNVTYAVAAGNDNANACNYSPARVANAITVGATTNTDARASFSNYGTCLDIFAPGNSITSSWNTNDTATNTISGTSMASPHTCGAAALYLQANQSATPQQVRDGLVNNATSGVVTNPGTGSPNKLLYSILGGTPQPTPTATSPIPGGEKIVNGGFESGTSPWVEYAANGYELIDTTRPHTGSYSVYMADYNSALDWIYQTVTIPTNANLRYWWYMTSSEGTTTAYDYLYTRLYNTSGGLVATLKTHTNKEGRGAWVQDTISLAAYAGQTLRVEFYATTDSSLVTAFFVDDVSVQ